MSASVLCLAVVFTVDWTPATRLKGVLMLVGLAYFAGLSLYFLKEEMVDRAKQAFGPGRSGSEFTRTTGLTRSGCRASPGRPSSSNRSRATR